MYGLTVRWSLASAREEAAKELREYVAGTSLARFTGLEGLRFKTWRMRAGEWFEGTYVFETAGARDGFESSFRQSAPSSAGTKIIGSEPTLIEPFEVVAVAEGGSRFASGPGPGAG
jgi:hypothetical protein